MISDFYVFYHAIISHSSQNTERSESQEMFPAISYISKQEVYLNYVCLCALGVFANIQSNYSSALTKNNSVYSPDHCRVANHHYEAVQFRVTKSGCYTFISKSDLSIIGYLYTHSFNVFNPNSEWFVSHHSNENNAQLNFTVQLDSTIKYVLIVSTYLPNKMGNFSIIVFGASEVIFTHMSKLCFSFENQPIPLLLLLRKY